MPFGFRGVLKAAAVVFLAYLGFDAVSTAAEEARKPQRDVPFGIIGSLALATLLYMAVSAIMTGVVPYTELNTGEPVAFALRSIGYNMGSALVGTGAIAGITTVLLVVMYGQTRVFYAMSRDGMLPAGICKIHPKYQTPHIITILSGIVVAIVSGLTPISVIAELTNIGTLFAFVITAVGVLVLRRTKPDIHRPFRCPAVTFVSLGAIISCGYLMYSLPGDTWVRYGTWSALGLIAYFAYGYRKSLLNPRNQEKNQAA